MYCYRIFPSFLNQQMRHKMTVTAIRHFENGLRAPSPYFPLTTELKGVANLAFGFLRLLGGVYMRYSSNPFHRSLTKSHIRIGAEEVRRGCIQVAPAITGGTVVYVIKKVFENYFPSTHKLDRSNEVRDDLILKGIHRF